MKYRRLGRTDLDVSLICLGTMTWGQQNTEAEAHAQIDYALDRGVNFIDAAEMYPVPPRPETQGRTESYIGTWLASRGRRDQIVLASKVAGPGNGMTPIRAPEQRLDKAQIDKAVDDSLKRLRTDYLDLYQVHWPSRQANFFGKAEYAHPPDETGIPDIEETLDALAGLVKQGKVRHVGLSNETAWGLHRYLELAETRGLPRVVSVQNPYNLLNRLYEVGLAEFSCREEVPLLAYSPLAMGVLAGKYLNGARPEDGRLTLFDRFTRYRTPGAEPAAAAYVAIARKYGLDPAQMAIAYVNAKAFVASNIVGATKLDQLKSDIDAVDVTVPPEALDEIEAVHRRNPNPCP